MITSFLHRATPGIIILILVLTSIAIADTPPALQQPTLYGGTENVTGWLMSEKLDGIRGYWNGKNLVTRKGRILRAPAWFTQDLPPFALDGELWRKRDDYNFVQNTVLDETPSEDWREITYNIFEVPDATGNFQDRLDRARAWFLTRSVSHVRIIEQIRCEGPEHLNEYFEKIRSMGGEGVVVKKANAAYEAGRSRLVLKVKHFDDMEGTVVAHNPGSGKFEGMMGSITVRLENGIEFRIGTGFNTEERLNPPPIGAIVTFKHQGFTQYDIPRFASYLRVRKD